MRIPRDPRWIAYDAVDEMIKEGLKKHAGESWRDEPLNNHLDKAARHIITHKLIKEGNQADDGEMHLKNALCRIAMGLTKEIDNVNLTDI